MTCSGDSGGTAYGGRGDGRTFGAIGGIGVSGTCGISLVCETVPAALSRDVTRLASANRLRVAVS